MSERRYYPLWFRLNQQDGYFLWFSDEPDGVFLTDDNRIVVSQNRASLKAYTAQLGLPLEPEDPLLHDLDTVQTWLLNQNASAIHCRDFLAAWNLFDDIRASVQHITDVGSNSAEIEDIYDKLFFGNNLPAITPEGKTYIPEWTSEEVTLLVDLFTQGLNDFRNRLFFSEPGGA